MKTIRVSVTKHDIHRAESDPSKCPVTRAISRTLNEPLYDVDIKRNDVYVWDEWDNPCQIYKLEEGTVCSYICDWESLTTSQPFEFNMTKRK